VSEVPAVGDTFSDGTTRVCVTGHYWCDEARWIEICNVGHGVNPTRRLVTLTDFAASWTPVT
jgi:hypothetical protein